MPNLGAAVAPRLGQLLLPDGPTELGLDAFDNHCLAIEKAPLERSDLSGCKTLFDTNDVVLVTGGARGVTADVVRALSTYGRPRLVLLGRTVLEPIESAWLSGLEEVGEIKRALLQQAKDGDEPVHAARDRGALTVESWGSVRFARLLPTFELPAPRSSICRSTCATRRRWSVASRRSLRCTARLPA